MDIPFKELTLVLKQVSVNQIGPDERRVLDYFATGFVGRGDEHAEIDPEAPLAMYAKKGFETHIDYSIRDDLLVMQRCRGRATSPCAGTRAATTAGHS